MFKEIQLQKVVFEYPYHQQSSKPAVVTDQKTVLKGGIQSGAVLSTTNAFSCFAALAAERTD